MEDNHKKPWMILTVIVVCVVVLGGITWATIWYLNSRQSGEEENQQVTSECQNISTDDWLTYEKGYSVSYPSDWVYKEFEGGVGATQWSVKFGPSSDNYLVYLGSTAKDLKEYIIDLESGDMNQITDKYQLLEQTEVKVVTENDTRLTLQGPESYKSYSFYLKPNTNLLPILLGPSDASSDQFENCETEKFLAMVESYEVATMPGLEGAETGDESSGSDYNEYYTYTDVDCNFSFKIQKSWQMTDRYYYKTAAGEEALSPTVLFTPTQPTIDSSKNYININMRQNFCADLGTHNQEPAIGGSSRVIDFYYYDQGEVCAEINLTGVNKNGKSTSHHFLMMYDSSIEGKKIFKDIVDSYSG